MAALALRQDQTEGIGQEKTDQSAHQRQQERQLQSLGVFPLQEDGNIGKTPLPVTASQAIPADKYEGNENKQRSPKEKGHCKEMAHGHRFNHFPSPFHLPIPVYS